MKVFLEKFLERFAQKRKNTFGIPDRWHLLLFATMFFCLLSVSIGYYVWFKVVNPGAPDADAPAPVKSVALTLDQKKLKAMLADLTLREETIRTGEVPTKNVIDPGN